MEYKYICDDCKKPTNNVHIIPLLTRNLVTHRCDECKEKLSAETEWQNEQFKEDDIVCPWCGDSFSEYEEMTQMLDSPYGDFDGTVECPSCGKEFELEIETTCTYTTRKPSELFNYDDWLEAEAEEALARMGE